MSMQYNRGLLNYFGPASEIIVGPTCLQLPWVCLCASDFRLRYMSVFAVMPHCKLFTVFAYIVICWLLIARSLVSIRRR